MSNILKLEHKQVKEIISIIEKTKPRLYQGRIDIKEGENEYTIIVIGTKTKEVKK